MTLSLQCHSRKTLAVSHAEPGEAAREPLENRYRITNKALGSW